MSDFWMLLNSSTMGIAPTWLQSDKMVLWNVFQNKDCGIFMACNSWSALKQWLLHWGFQNHSYGTRSSKVWEVQLLWKVTSCLHRNSLLPFVFSFHLKASKACAVVSAAKASYSYIPGYWDVIPKPSSPKTLYGKLIMTHTYYWQREKFFESLQ